MRNSRVIALVVASLVSTASFAQAQSAPADRGARQEQRGVKGGKGVKGERAMRGARGRGHMLRGIKLSDAEKTKLKAIRARYRTEGQALRTSVRPAMLEVRAARQKGDTAALRALRARNSGTRTQVKALHDRQVSEIRAALSAGNQRLFDANIAERARRRAEMAKSGRVGERRGAKGERKGGRHGLPRGRRAGTNG